MIFDWGSVLNTNDTPSVTAFAVTAPPEGAPRAASPLAVLAPLNNDLPFCINEKEPLVSAALSSVFGEKCGGNSAGTGVGADDTANGGVFQGGAALLPEGAAVGDILLQQCVGQTGIT